VAVDPGGQPGANVAAAGDRGQILERSEHPFLGEPLDHTERVGGAADAAAGEAERRAGPPLRGALVHGGVDLGEPHLMDRANRAGARHLRAKGLFEEKAVEVDRVVALQLHRAQATQVGRERRLQELILPRVVEPPDAARRLRPERDRIQLLDQRPQQAGVGRGARIVTGSDGCLGGGSELAPQLGGQRRPADVQRLDQRPRIGDLPDRQLPRERVRTIGVVRVERAVLLLQHLSKGQWHAHGVLLRWRFGRRRGPRRALSWHAPGRATSVAERAIRLLHVALWSCAVDQSTAADGGDRIGPIAVPAAMLEPGSPAPALVPAPAEL
jgi:hypothetical protein